MIRRIAFIHTVAMLADQLGLPVFASPELLVQEVVARVRSA
jgi:hypothetical protein